MSRESDIREAIMEGVKRGLREYEVEIINLKIRIRELETKLKEKEGKNGRKVS